MATSDLAARPVFPRLREGIDARLTVVFAALAVSREAQARTGQSINEIVTPAGADADKKELAKQRAASRPASPTPKPVREPGQSMAVRMVAYEEQADALAAVGLA